MICTRIKHKLNTKIVTFLILSIIVSHLSVNVFPYSTSSLLSSGTKGDYYGFEFNSTDIEKTTDGKIPVKYSIKIINTGNIKDTYSLFVNIQEVTNCEEPDIHEWTFEIDKSEVTLEPSLYTEIICEFD